MNGGVPSEGKTIIYNAFNFQDPFEELRSKILGGHGRPGGNGNQQTFENAGSVQQRKRVRLTEFDQFEPLCKKKKIKAKTNLPRIRKRKRHKNGQKYTKNSFNPATAYSWLGESNNQQVHLAEDCQAFDWSETQKPQNLHEKRVIFEGQAPHNDPGYGSGNDNQTVSSGSSDCDTEDSSDYGDVDHYDTDCGIRYSDLRYDGNIIRKKDSFSLAQIKLSETEKEKYENIWQEMGKILSDSREVGECGEDDIEKLKGRFDEVINQALKQRIMFTFPYENNKSFVDLIINSIQELYWVDSTENFRLLEKKKIVQIISEGATLNEFTGKEYDDYVNCIYRQEEILSKRKEYIQELSNLADKSIVNKNNEQIHEYDFKAEIDNGYFCIEYPQDSMIEPAKILNNEKAKDLRVGILKVGESIVRVEKDEKGKRNYTNVLKGSIEMSFTTEVGKISIYLSPDKQDSNKIKVEINEENIAKFNELKDKSSIGANCFLGGKSVLEAIENRGFEKHGKVPATEFAEVKVSSRENGVAPGA